MNESNTICIPCLCVCVCQCLCVHAFMRVHHGMQFCKANGDMSRVTRYEPPFICQCWQRHKMLYTDATSKDGLRLSGTQRKPQGISGQGLE
jgi:hypothetical protein